MKTLADVKQSSKAQKKSKVNGYIVYEGASNINGEPIVAIVTMKSTNIKTGNMASLWILNSELSPTEASKQGKDVSVCGDCKLRQNKGGACYVTLFHAPLKIWKAYKKGNYPKIDNDYSKFIGTRMRFGAYGDPQAMPIDILNKLKGVVVNNTSYTHQWRKADDLLKTMSMASVDDLKEKAEAVAKGWRTFRVAKEDSIIDKDEIVCPNYTKNVQCIDCNLCSGTSTKAKNIVIPVHGARKKRF